MCSLYMLLTELPGLLYHGPINHGLAAPRYRYNDNEYYFTQQPQRVRSTYREISVDRRSVVYHRVFRIVSRYSSGYALVGIQSENQIQQHESRCARFKRLFQPNQPSIYLPIMSNPCWGPRHMESQWRRRCKIIITQKSTCLTSGSTHITNFFLQVMCELKIAQSKVYESEHWRSGPSLYDCQMMRSRMKSRVLRAFSVTLELKKGVANPWFIGP